MIAIEQQIPVLAESCDPSDYLGNGIEAEWVKTGFNTERGVVSWYVLSFTPNQVLLDVTGQSNFDYLDAVADPKHHVWFVTIAVNNARHPQQPARVTLRARCVGVFRANCRTIAQFELSYRSQVTSHRMHKHDCYR